MKNKWLMLLIIGTIVIVIILYVLGFRITYAPELENNWTAIDAVGTWVGVLSPLFLAIINAAFAKNIERTKNEISSSNRVIYEQNSAHKDKSDEKNIEQKILDYITVSITANTEEIAKFAKMNMDEAFDLLCEMQVKSLIVGINHRKNIDKSKVIWKLSR